MFPGAVPARSHQREFGRAVTLSDAKSGFLGSKEEGVRGSWYPEPQAKGPAGLQRRDIAPPAHQHPCVQACTHYIVLSLCLQMGRERFQVAMPGLKPEIPPGSSSDTPESCCIQAQAGTSMQLGAPTYGPDRSLWYPQPSPGSATDPSSPPWCMPEVAQLGGQAPAEVGICSLLPSLSAKHILGFHSYLCEVHTEQAGKSVSIYIIYASYWTGLAWVIDMKKPPNALKSSRSQDPWTCQISLCQPLQGLDSTQAFLRSQVGNKWRPLPSRVLPAPFPAGVTHKDRTPCTFLPVDSFRKATPSSFSALWEKPLSLPKARPKYCISQVVRRILNACIHKLSVADFFCTTPQSFTMLAGCGPDEKYFQDLPKLHSSYSCFICPKQFSQMTLDGKCFNGL